MYESYFELKENPFRITPDPRFLWYSDQHLEAKDKILYHINHSVGPIYLVAPIGTGKTSLARRVMEELSGDKSKQVAFVFSPKLTTNAFLRFVMEEFGAKTHRSYAGCLRNFQWFLTEQYKKGVSPILIVDEAQNMTREMLILIQHLFNFSTDKEFLIQIALFTQPELVPKLKRLPSLDSRMSIAKIKPFSFQETKEMMKFRWAVAGGNQFPFTDDAVFEIHKYSEGIPRIIVKLSNESLLRSAVDKLKLIDCDTVIKASLELSST